ncbi:hypothetical protein GCM10010213_24250 [Microbacterium maritypicum]|uniref:Secreted protein n=1 Tax=Microbacterium maritypicum TaxID=33918 RepID=A0A4Y4B6Y6_MICMQ|nr:hypothetical protein MLI01_24330 [Microbacterium liquefaciens]GGV60799.1 hypothetical protein GCM10010213_24250 [Microbacterium liquefaciens]
MICSRTIGIIRAMTAAMSALAAPPASRQMTGFTKGFRRHSAAGVERVDDGEGFCAEGEEDMSLRRVSYGQRVRKGTDARADSQSPASDEEGAGWL